MRLTTHRHVPDVPAATGEIATIELEQGPDGLQIRIDAPFHGDPAPDAPPGRLDRLWEHEVIEVFVAGPGDPVPYLEVEVGPHGHWLALTLRGVRQPVDWHVPVNVTWESASNARWSAVARVPASYLPEQPWRVNATAIHGVGDDRRYLTDAPLPGAPNFHQPDAFVPFEVK